MNKWILIITLFFSLLLPPLYPSDKLPDAVVSEIWSKIYENDFEAVRQIVIRENKNYKKNINLLSFYEIALNGLDRKKDSLKVRKKILKIWNEKHKETFEKEKYPLNLASYIRMVVVEKNKLILGSEYYTPYPINNQKEGYYYHKITVYNRNSKNQTHQFKLERSKYTNENYVLYEIDSIGKSTDLHNYGGILPNLEDEIKVIQKKLQ